MPISGSWGRALRFLLWWLLCWAAGCKGESQYHPDASSEREPGRPMRDAAPAHSPDAADDAGPGDAGPADSGVDADADDDAGGDLASCGELGCDLLDPLSCDDTQGCVLLVEELSGDVVPQCTAVGAGRDGESCDSHLDCRPSLDCTGAGGACRRYCCALNQVAGCPGGQFCRVALTDSEGAATGVALCDRCDECDLLDMAGCGEGLGCYALPGGSGCLACLGAGAVELGEDCERANDCVAGTGCFATDAGGGRCLAYCSMAEPSCGAGTSCRQVQGIELAAGVGLCL